MQNLATIKYSWLLVWHRLQHNCQWFEIGSTHQWYKKTLSIPSFRLRDNSVYVHECSPFLGRTIFLQYVYSKKCLKLCTPLMLRTIIYFHVYIMYDFPITYRNASVVCQSECACLHKTVNMVVFFVKSNENIPTQKGEHSC